MFPPFGLTSRPTPLLDEPLMSLAQIAALFPPQRAGRPVHPETIKYWILKGVRLPDGSRVRLEAVRVGSRWLSDRSRVARFCAQQTPVVGSETFQANPSQRRRVRGQTGVARGCGVGSIADERP